MRRRYLLRRDQRRAQVAGGDMQAAGMNRRRITARLLPRDRLNRKLRLGRSARRSAALY